MNPFISYLVKTAIGAFAGAVTARITVNLMEAYAQKRLRATIPPISAMHVTERDN